MTNFSVNLVLFVLLAFANSSQAMDIKTLISSKIINKEDSLGRNNGLWIDLNEYFTILSNYNEEGKYDGLSIILRNKDDGKFTIDDVCLFENGLLKEKVSFYDDGAIACIEDKVQPLDAEMFPSVAEAEEKCRATEIGKYGLAQFYIIGYNQYDGSLQDEGWYCSFLDADNLFDDMMDLVPIGIHKFYEDGKVIERDKTDSSIEDLLHMAGLLKYDYE